MGNRSRTFISHVVCKVLGRVEPTVTLVEDAKEVELRIELHF
jgi:hypothetical protein